MLIYIQANITIALTCFAWCMAFPPCHWGPGDHPQTLKSRAWFPQTFQQTNPTISRSQGGSHLHRMFFFSGNFGLENEADWFKTNTRCTSSIGLCQMVWCESTWKFKSVAWFTEKSGPWLGVYFEELSRLVVVGLCFYLEMPPNKHGQSYLARRGSTTNSDCNQLSKLV